MTLEQAFELEVLWRVANKKPTRLKDFRIIETARTRYCELMLEYGSLLEDEE